MHWDDVATRFGAARTLDLALGTTWRARNVRGVTTNAEQREYWNQEGARHWVDHQARYDEMLAPFGRAVVDAAAIEPVHRVLDVGCGNGATTRAAARAAGDGSALGIDLSEAMLECARATSRDEGIPNIEFEVADAQTRPFDAEFDRVISRFGVMFFEDPVAAFTNIRRALRDGGRLAVVVWQDVGANEWVRVPSAAVFQHVSPPEAADPGAPGPFSLGDPDRVRSILDDAGFSDVSVDPFETPLLLGGHGSFDEAADFQANSGMAARLLGDAPPEVVERALTAMREALRPYATPDGVQLDAAAWIVTASSRH